MRPLPSNHYKKPFDLPPSPKNEGSVLFCQVIAERSLIYRLLQRKKTLVYLLGYIENEKNEKREAPNVINKKKAEKLIAKYLNEENVYAEFDKLKDKWYNFLGNFAVKSSDEKFDRVVNIRNQYQWGLKSNPVCRKK